MHAEAVKFVNWFFGLNIWERKVDKNLYFEAADSLCKMSIDFTVCINELITSR